MYPQPHFDPQKEVKWGQRGPNLIFSIYQCYNLFFFLLQNHDDLKRKLAQCRVQKRKKNVPACFIMEKSDNFQILFFITIEIDQMSLPANFSKVLL